MIGLMNRFMRGNDRERVPLTEPGTHVSIIHFFSQRVPEW